MIWHELELNKMISIKNKKSGLIINSFSSVSDIRGYIASPMAIERNTHVLGQQMSNGRGKDWYGVDGGFDDVVRMVDTGYPEGLQTLTRFYDSVKATLPKAIGSGRTVRRGDNGDTLDIHAVNRGALDKAWSKSVRTLKKAKTPVRIVVDTGGSCWVNSDSLMWRGVAAIALADIMTKAGYMVEIVGAFCTSNYLDNTRKANSLIVAVTVKPYGSYVNRELLSSTVSLAGFFRTYGFNAIIKAADDQGLTVSGGLGQSVSIEVNYPMVEKVTQLFITQSIKDKASADKWVRDSIKLLQG